MTQETPGPAGFCQQIRGLRHGFLLVVMLVCLGWGSAVILATQFGALPMPDAQHHNNMLFIGAVALLLLWRVPDQLPLVASGFLLASHALVAAALPLVPQDEMRITFFFMLAGASFLVQGPAAGWAAIGLALVLVPLAMAQGWLALSWMGFSSFGITLVSIGVLFHVFGRLLVRALRQVAEHNAALAQMALRDPLTGLPNLRAFRAALAAERGSFAVAFIDTDHFKSVNDRFGHAGGDRVLMALARQLRALLRQGDSIARIGGEEFAVLMPGTGLEGARALAERLRLAVAGMPLELEGTRLALTVSIGVASSQGGRATPEAVLQAADRAMYAAKAAGRNRVEAAPP